MVVAAQRVFSSSYKEQKGLWLITDSFVFDWIVFRIRQCVNGNGFLVRQVIGGSYSYCGEECSPSATQIFSFPPPPFKKLLTNVKQYRIILSKITLDPVGIVPAGRGFFFGGDEGI
jgi:hypothetical protein